MAQPNNPKMQEHANEMQQHVNSQAGKADSVVDQAAQKHPQEPKKGTWAKSHEASPAPDPNVASGPVNAGPATKAGSATGVPGAGQVGSE